MTSENASRTMAKGAISALMPSVVSAQNPANRMGVKRHVIQSGVAREAPAARPSKTQMPTAMSVTMTQIAFVGKYRESPLVKFSHPTITTTGSPLSAILDVI